MKVPWEGEEIEIGPCEAGNALGQCYAAQHFFGRRVNIYSCEEQKRMTGCPKLDLKTYGEKIEDRERPMRHKIKRQDDDDQKKIYFSFIKNLVANRTAWERWGE